MQTLRYLVFSGRSVLHSVSKSFFKRFFHFTEPSLSGLRPPENMPSCILLHDCKCLLHFVCRRLCNRHFKFVGSRRHHSTQNTLNPKMGLKSYPYKKLKRIAKAILFNLSVGGLEPPQIAPHAPQTCASTIPPHRHIQKLNFQSFLYFIIKFLLLRVYPSRKKILNLFSRHSAIPTYTCP